MLVLGGRANAFDDLNAPFLVDVVAAVRNFHQRELPVFGICLGAQLLARALGTDYRSNNGWEVAFTPLNLTEEGVKDPVFGRLPRQCRMYEMHQDAFYLPEGATRMMEGEACNNQAFRVGKASYGVQFHPEVDESGVQEWARKIALDPDHSVLHRVMRDYAPDEFVSQSNYCREIATAWLGLCQ